MANPPLLPAELLAIGEACGALLRERSETVAVAEGSAGGLMSVALLAVPGASDFYRGGATIYTGPALRGMLSGLVELPQPLQGASEPWARHLAAASRAHVATDWGVGEGGAAGPSGNPYGDPPGHGWVAVDGGSAERQAARHVLTGNDDRLENMVAFAVAGLELLHHTLSTSIGSTP
jgi:PncC family amidohydrolase